MPKNKKPAGARPAKNFEPRYGAKKKTGPTAGSRSPKHRGYRDEGPQNSQKNRWSADERQARSKTGGRPQQNTSFASDSSGERRSERKYHSRDDRFAPERSKKNLYEKPSGSRRTPRSQPDTRTQRESRFYSDDREKKNFTPVEDVVLERLEAKAILAEDVQGKSFSDLGLGSNISRQLSSMGATTPFPIQAATIPDVLAGKDVLGRGKTGSGKTIAFGAPIVERLMENNGGKDRKHGRSPRALILAPTRELAMQIDRTVQPIARSVGLFTTTIYGGVPQGKQVGSLRRGVDIIIATPGRLEDLVEQRHIDLSKIMITVLDEADHMCDLGFLEPVQRILRATQPGGQRLLFSATLDKGVAAIVDEFLENPSVHEVAGEDQASSTIDHKVLVVDQRDKTRIIEQLADREGKTLIFTRTRSYAETLADNLEDAGIPATSLHGDLNQNRRTRNLSLLTSGRVNVLVATDVAARGIHVDDIDLVIQADAPDEYKTYMHRAGRTGRAGKEGTVVTLIPKARQRRMNDLLNRAEISAPMVPVRLGDDVVRELAHSK